MCLYISYIDGDDPKDQENIRRGIEYCNKLHGK